MTITDTTNDTYMPSKGDRVVFAAGFGRTQDIGVVYVVERLLPKNVELRPENRAGRGVKCPPYMLTAAPAPGEPVPTAQVVPYQPPLNYGQVVKMRGKDGLFVVTSQRNGKYALFPLGGSTRYYPGVDRALIIPQTVTSIETADA